jgi:1-acyl-sn-glycerol-3-phosphate acyltransferase
VRVEVVYTPVIGAALTMFKAMNWDVRVSGAEHIPPTGPGVIATNHVSHLDFIFVGAGVRHQDKRRLRFLAKKEIFGHPVAGPMMRSMRHIPVDRDGGGRPAMDAARAALQRGEVIGMFPEATISPSFVPLPGKTGSARLAMETGSPLIPGVVWGSQRLMTKGRPRNLQRGVAITVDFGPAIPYEPDEDVQAVHDRLMTAIRELLAGAQARNPQTPANDDDRWWLPAHLGGTAPKPEA